MKKAFLLTSLIIGFATTYAHAQGTILFANTYSTLVYLDADATAALGLPVNSPVPLGDQFLLNLYYAPARDAQGNPLPDPGDAGMVAMGTPVYFNRSPGRFGWSNWTTPDTTAPGDNAWFQVRAWESAFGTNYEQAVNAPAQTINGVTRYAIAGTSTRFNIPTGTAAGSLPITQAGGLQSFFLNIFPGGPLFRINDIAVAEGTNDTVNAVFTVSLLLFRPTNATFSVDFATANGSALAGQDYVATNGTLVFNPGETQKLVSVVVTADVPVEPEEDFFVNLSNPVNAAFVKAQGRALITEVRITGISVDVAVSFNTVLNRGYVVEKSVNMSTWNPVPGATNVLGNGSIVTIVDVGAGCAPQQTYRARLLP